MRVEEFGVCFGELSEDVTRRVKAGRGSKGAFR